MTNILLVDDFADFAELMQLHLGDNGYSMTWAPDGEAAIAYEGEYDIVLLDLRLPDLTAVEIATRIRAVRPGVAMILLSADSPTAIRETANTLDIPYLRKPFKLATLMDAVKNAR
jgi:DNA-binding response OmpR family regulator